MSFGTNFDGGCIDCLSRSVAWSEFGFPIVILNSSLTGCSRYTQVQREYIGGSDAGVCAVDIVGCPSTVVATLDYLLADPVVISALQQHTVFGVAFAEDVSPRTISTPLGYFKLFYCRPTAPSSWHNTDCLPAPILPAPIRELDQLLTTIDAQQRMREPCKSALAF